MKLSRYFSFAVLVGVIGLLTVLFYKVMASFFVPLFLAVLLVVVFRPWHRWMLTKFPGRKALAALLTTVSIFLAVLIPVALLMTVAILEGRTALRRFQLDNIGHELLVLRTSLNLNIPAVEELRATEKAIEEITSTKLDSLGKAAQKGLIESSDAAIRDFATQARLPTSFESEPGPVDFFRAETTAEAWHRFVHEFNQLKEKIEAAPPPPQPVLEADQGANSHPIGVEESAEPDTAETSDAETVTLPQQMRRTLAAIDNFKNSYCGGKMWYWLKMLLNPSEEELGAYNDSATNFLKEQLLSVGGATTALLIKLVIGLIIMIVSVYFFLLDGPAMIENLRQVSPISDSHEEELLQEFMRVSRAVVLATLLSAIAQGILAGLGFFVAGLGNVFLLTLLTICFAMIPIGGAAIVWVPACLWLFLFEHQTAKAIALGIYGTFIISGVDNIIKPYVLHGQSKLHPLFALLSVLGGVVALGPIGILIGPMVFAFLQTMLKILQRELSSIDATGQAVTVEVAGKEAAIATDGIVGAANSSGKAAATANGDSGHTTSGDVSPDVGVGASDPTGTASRQARAKHSPQKKPGDQKKRP